MTSTFAADLAAYLAARGIGTVGTSLFVGQIPATGSDAVLIIPTGGEVGEPGLAVDFPSVQITARASTWSVVNTKAWAVYGLLNAPAAPLVMGSTTATYCKAIQQPTSLGLDEDNKWRIVCNYRFHVPR